MEFMNVGGGELLIIILLALVLFGPEDILKLTRTIGKYARTARQMWSNVSKSLQDDYIPDEVKEVVKETASSVKEAKTTLSSVRKQLNTMTASVKEDVENATKVADNELSQALTTINDIALKTNQSENSILNGNKGTPIQTPDEETDLNPVQPSTSNGMETIETKFTDDAISLTKETPTKKHEHEGAVHANSVYSKLAKMTEDSLKDGEDGS